MPRKKLTTDTETKKGRKPYTTAQALKGKLIVNVTVPPIHPDDPTIQQVLVWMRDDALAIAIRFEEIEREQRAQRKAWPITAVPAPDETVPPSEFNRFEVVDPKLAQATEVGHENATRDGR